MAAVAQQLIDLHSAPESFDPADLEGAFHDGTAARKQRKSGQLINLEHDGRPPSGKAQLQMRQKIPVLDKYAGKNVARKEVFDHGGSANSHEEQSEDGGTEDGEEDEDADEGEDSEDSTGAMAEPASISAPDNFNISVDLEKEYEKMMKKSQGEMSLLRAPSAADVAKKEAEAKQLKEQMAAWSALVELRIHLETSLTIAHRLPVGNGFAAVHETAASKEADAVAGDVRELLSSLLDLQRNLAQQRGIPTVDEALRKPKKRQKLQEADSWAMVDAQLQPVMDWGLGIADEWKERTRLDARRSFKVLDQSLTSQMRASEAEPEKVRRRCTPPPGRHQVFGISSQPAASSNAEDDAGSAKDVEQDIFDDRDFYVQLLREALTSGNRQTEGEESRELQMELQGRRASKKRNRAEVERRASKGRKIRYVAIEKLQNFVASRPRSDNANGHTFDPLLHGEHAVDALLRSLFSSAKGM